MPDTDHDYFTGQWWKRTDVKRHAVLWVILTAFIGYVGTEVQVRALGTPASEVMENVINLMRIFTWAAAPVAAYVPAVKTGNLVFTAGQLPVVDGKLVQQGKVGSDVTPEDAKKMAEICALNALAAISLVADIDQIEKIVRVGGFVNGAPGFVAIPAVINGASELLIKLFGDVNGKHARTAVGVAELPLNAPVEVEMVVQLKAK